MSEVPNPYIDCNSTFSPNLVHDISSWASNNDGYFNTSIVHLDASPGLHSCASPGSEWPFRRSKSVGRTVRRVKDVSSFCARREAVMEQPILGGCCHLRGP